MILMTERISRMVVTPPDRKRRTKENSYIISRGKVRVIGAVLASENLRPKYSYNEDFILGKCKENIQISSARENQVESTTAGSKVVG